jgi:hypothetical protein
VRTFWIIAAAFGGAAAVFFVIRDDFDKAFIAAALGAVAWFLNYRAQLTTDKTEGTDETDKADEGDEG